MDSTVERRVGVVRAYPVDAVLRVERRVERTCIGRLPPATCCLTKAEENKAAAIVREGEELDREVRAYDAISEVKPVLHLDWKVLPRKVEQLGQPLLCLARARLVAF